MITKNAFKKCFGGTLVAVQAVLLSSALWAQTPLPVPLIKENTTVKVSDHVWVIPDGNVPVVPDVGIVVGSRATLIIDTGLGRANGETVLRELAKVSKNETVYVATTHFHAEHTTGGVAFPPSFRFVRPIAQQKDVQEFGAAFFDLFSKRSPEMAELMKGSTYPGADIMFENDYTIDLGGVRVQLAWLGPTHTRGDTSIFIEGDRVLFSGDLAMNKLYPAFASPYSDGVVWLASLDKLAAMQPKVVVGSHGGIGDASLISDYRNVLKTVQTRTKELKAQGKTEEEIGKLLTAELTAKYPDWGQSARVPVAVGYFYKMP